jgi:hypothetical protein
VHLQGEGCTKIRPEAHHDASNVLKYPQIRSTLSRTQNSSTEVTGWVSQDNCKYD